MERKAHGDRSPEHRTHEVASLGVGKVAVDERVGLVAVVQAHLDVLERTAVRQTLVLRAANGDNAAEGCRCGVAHLNLLVKAQVLHDDRLLGARQAAAGEGVLDVARGLAEAQGHGVPAATELVCQHVDVELAVLVCDAATAHLTANLKLNLHVLHRQVDLARLNQDLALDVALPLDGVVAARRLRGVALRVVPLGLDGADAVLLRGARLWAWDASAVGRVEERAYGNVWI